MEVLEAPGTDQDEVCESCSMCEIADAVVGVVVVYVQVTRINWRLPTD